MGGLAVWQSHGDITSLLVKSVPSLSLSLSLFLPSLLSFLPSFLPSFPPFFPSFLPSFLSFLPSHLFQLSSVWFTFYWRGTPPCSFNTSLSVSSTSMDMKNTEVCIYSIHNIFTSHVFKIPYLRMKLHAQCVHVLMRDERKKQARSNKQTNKAKQHSTPTAVTFPKKNELPWAA